jgi:hypothetical protein
MNPKRLPLWLGAIGAILLVPGTLWVANSGRRLTDDDARVALQPLYRVHLDMIDQGPISVMLMIPNTIQWTKISNVWGEPEFVISAVASDGQSITSLATSVRTELVDATGRVIPLLPSGPAYGYSGSAMDSLRFRAAPGRRLTLKLGRTRQIAVVTGDLIVVSDWFDTKDKLVGRQLDQSIESLLKLVSISGLLLVLSGGCVFFVIRIRRHAVD